MRVMLAGLLALLLAGPAWAGRTPSTRTEGTRVASPTDIRVPYLNHGTNAFQGYSVGVQIYSSPVLDSPSNPGARPVYNLPFYGARMGFSGRTNGIVPKPTLLPSQGR